MFSPQLFEMIAQSRQDEVAANAERRRFSMEHSDQIAVGWFRFARLRTLFSELAHAVRDIPRSLPRDRSTAIESE
jgi:hypothetical protein